MSGSPDVELGKDEGQPLLTQATPRMNELVLPESIYGFMTIYPELHRVRYGSYLNCKVGVAFALIVFNILLQVSLTMIAGSSIFEEMRAYKSSLTQGAESVTESAAELMYDVNDDYLNIPGLTRNEKEETCCVGDQCANLGAPCCARRHGHTNATSLLQGDKPAAKAKGKKGSGAGAEQRRALCFDDEVHGLDCTPPTYAFMHHWDDLDANKDGVWSKEEAEADEANLACKLGVPVAEVFRAVISGSRKYAKEISKTSVLPEVEMRLAVPRDYFHRWKGMVAMCSAVDHNRCSGLIKDGVFDGALEMARVVPRDGITSLEKALDYCQTMLMPGGVCDKALPVTYMMYRQQVADKCGPPTFSNGIVYSNPHDDTDVMRMVALSYPKLDKYTMADSYIFQFFLILILMVWYVNLLGELGAIIHLADFAWNFPGAVDADPLYIGRGVRRFRHSAGNWMSRLRGEEVGEPRYVSKTARTADPDATTIEDISEVHRIALFLVVFVRLWLLAYMAKVGTVFTLNTYSYPDLLMNAVALAFVFELPEFLYGLLVRAEDKRELENIGTLEYKTSMPRMTGIKGVLVSVYFWGLVVFPITTLFEVYWHHEHEVEPIFEALRCACLQEGDRCVAEQSLQRSWWNTQWANLRPM